MFTGDQCSSKARLLCHWLAVQEIDIHELAPEGTHGLGWKFMHVREKLGTFLVVGKQGECVRALRDPQGTFP